MLADTSGVRSFRVRALPVIGFFGLMSRRKGRWRKQSSGRSARKPKLPVGADEEWQCLPSSYVFCCLRFSGQGVSRPGESLGQRAKGTIGRSRQPDGEDLTHILPTVSDEPFGWVSDLDDDGYLMALVDLDYVCYVVSHDLDLYL